MTALADQIIDDNPYMCSVDTDEIHEAVEVITMLNEDQKIELEDLIIELLEEYEWNALDDAELKAMAYNPTSNLAI